MSGILNAKQRIMDFSLTREGYQQVNNGDLRIKYATLNDKNAIYDSLPESFNVADLEAMPFLFENFDTDMDIINPEIDLNLSFLSTNSENNITTITDYENNKIEITNGQLITSSSDIENILLNLTSMTNNSLEKSSILLSDNYINYDLQSDSNFDISLELKKINNQNISNTIDTLNFSINTNEDKSILINNIKSGSYYTFLEEELTINNNTMLEDSRFINKLPLLFLPPSNMNPDIVTKNNSILNQFNVSEDKRRQSKVIYKNIKNIDDSILINNITDLKDLTEGLEINNSIYNLDILSNTNLNYSGSEGQISIDNLNKILSFEMEFNNSEKNCPFLFQMYETNPSTNQNNPSTFNRLLTIDHGEIYDNNLKKNINVYSIGKIYHTKTDIDIREKISSDKTIDNKFISSNNYQFINLFTVIIH